MVSRSNEIATGADNGTWAYGYDPAGRAALAIDPDDTATVYGYDAAGTAPWWKSPAARMIRTS